MNTSTNKPPASQMERDRLDQDKIRTEIMKMLAETAKINREARWYPLIALTAFVTALFAAFHVFHS